MSKERKLESGAFRRFRRSAFIEAYTQFGSVARAAREVGINRDTHYAWMKDPDYKREFEEATELAVFCLEDEARERALHGTETLLYYKGEPVIDPRTDKPYVKRRPSDKLLMFLLSALAPEKFREQRPARDDIAMLDRQLDQLRRFVNETTRAKINPEPQAQQPPPASNRDFP